MTATLDRQPKGCTLAGVTEVLRALGITYRQLDYWARMGYIHVDGSNAGSGSRRRFTPDDIDRLAVIAAMADAHGQSNVDGALIAAVWSAFDHVPPRHWFTVYAHHNGGVWTIRDQFDCRLAPCAFVLDIASTLALVDELDALR